MSITALTEIFRETLEIDDLQLTPQLSGKDIEEWDSFNHLNLMIAIEEEFAVKLQPQEVEVIKSVNDLVDLLKGKGVSIGW